MTVQTTDLRYSIHHGYTGLGERLGCRRDQWVAVVDDLARKVPSEHEFNGNTYRLLVHPTAWEGTPQDTVEAAEQEAVGWLRANGYQPAPAPPPRVNTGAEADIAANNPGGLAAHRRDEAKAFRARDPETKGFGLDHWEE